MLHDWQVLINNVTQNDLENVLGACDNQINDIDMMGQFAKRYWKCITSDLTLT